MARQRSANCKKLCTCCNQSIMVDNAVLMYVSSYRSSSAHLNLKNAVLSHFTAEDVAAARQMMEESVRVVIPDHPLIGKRRTTSVNRPACDANLEDIVEMFKSLDKCENEDIPQYVCSSASSLPPAAPEAAGNLLAVLQSVAAQQRQIAEMQETMTTLRLDIESATQKANKNEGEINKLTAEHHRPLRRQNKSAQPVLGAQIAGDRAAAREDSQESGLVSDESDAQSQDSDQHASDDGNKGKPSQPSPAVVTQRNDSYAAALQAPSLVGEEGFKKGGKRPNKGQGKKKTSQGGTSESSEILTAGPEKFMVQITNVNSNLDEGKINEYLVSKGIENATVENTSSENWSTKRFLITLSYQNYSTVMAPEFWPKRIYFKRWFPARKNN